MARKGQASIEFNQRYFDTIMKSAGVESLSLAKAQAALKVAQANAPYDTGDYHDGLRIRRAERKYRTAFLVEGTDPKTLLIESQTGNLARALKSVKGP